MSALGNILGFFSIRLPSTPSTTVEFHLSTLPALLLAVSIGPLAGAITGILSLIIATLQIGNIFIPFGNAILAGVAGLCSHKLKFSPPLSAFLGEVVESPYTWLTCMLYSVPQPVIAFIIAKAFIEVLISGTIVELILRNSQIRELLMKFKT